MCVFAFGALNTSKIEMALKAKTLTVPGSQSCSEINVFLNSTTYVVLGSLKVSLKIQFPYTKNTYVWSLKARAVLPSSSAVNWASMIMGSGPELHGFTEWGSKTPELPSRVLGEESGLYPSIFSLVEKQLPERKTGVFYTWGGIGYLFEKLYGVLSSAKENGNNQLIERIWIK